MDWVEVRIIETKEDFNKLPEKEAKNIPWDAYKKKQFDMKER